jgi:hypothetical protein
MKQHKLEFRVYLKKEKSSDIGKELDAKGVGVNMKLYHRWGRGTTVFLLPGNV